MQGCQTYSCTKYVPISSKSYLYVSHYHHLCLCSVAVGSKQGERGGEVKSELKREKESQDFTQSKLGLQLTKVMRWERVTVNKEEKLAWVANELNDYAKKLKASKEEGKRALNENEVSKHELEKTRCELEETIYELRKQSVICVL